MSNHEGRTDEAVGRAKEALGAITDDDELRREGRADQAGGKVKSKLSEIVDEAKQKVNRLLNRDDDEKGRQKQTQEQSRGQ